jgi:hypothetical protein
MPHLTTPFARRATVARALLGGALLTGACGPATAGPDVASVSGDNGESASPGTTAAPGAADPKEAFLAYAQCMREHGVDMPDPEVNDDGGVNMRLGGDPGEIAGLEDAEKACRPALDEAMQADGRKPDPAQEAEMKDRALRFSQCMREHGVDMPDPVFEDGGRMKMTIGGPDGGEGPDPESPAFQEAEKACQPIMGDMAPGRVRKGAGPSSGADVTGGGK